MTRHKSWMDRERDSVEWQTGMNDFLNLAFDGAHPDSTVPCPCRRCLNIVQKKKRDVHSDLLLNGMDPTYTHWIYHGEQSDEGSMSEDSDNEDDVDDGSGVCDMLNTLIRGTNMQSNENIGEGVGDIHVDDSSGDERNQEPNATAKVFFELLKEAKKELYPGCKDFMKLSFIVKLYQIKCVSGMTNRACDLLLQMFTQVLPKGHYIPTNLGKVRKVIRDLGLDYKKIHACAVILIHEIQSIQVWLLKLVCCNFETCVIYLVEMVCYILLKSCVICPYIYLDVVLLIC
uniref:Transposase-associated domain-containing protein n=1 Tax=Aegilops tauschii subsp. strangulata TaxID=200361 RepID=A0A453JP08_AEGTS